MRSVHDGDLAGPDFEVAADEPSVGVRESGYWRAAEYDIGGNSILISTTRVTSFDACARSASYPDYLALVHDDRALAVWTPEAGNILTYEPGNGVKVSIEGAPTLDQAIATASNLDCPMMPAAGANLMGSTTPSEEGWTLRRDRRRGALGSRNDER